MLRKAGLGIQEFHEIREENVFYIDKTLFIKEWWENKDKVTLITRPRRFGKSLNMSMLHEFLSVEYANRGDLFEGLAIWNEEEYRALQGTYPVIFLSFANVKGDSFKMTSYLILQFLMELYEKFSFLLESDVLSNSAKKRFERMREDMSEKEAPLALYLLSNYLYQYYGKEPIILLDEYDTPMQEAYAKGFWDELVSFMQLFFNTTFKTNPYMKRGLMTGITRVSKESIFSDLNNPEVVTTTSEQYATYFGFTEKEVFSALEEYGYGDRKEEVKYWYDGFAFGDQKDIYNPWSILNFLGKGKIDTYWANTSSNKLVSDLVRKGDPEIKNAFEDLLQGKSIFCRMDEQIVYDQLNDNNDAIFSLLLASGYLKVMYHGKKVSGQKTLYELSLTNAEVKDMFYILVRGWFGSAQRNYNEFVKALLLGDVKAMNVYMNQVALQTFSYFDTGKEPSLEEPERFYHGFVLGLIVDLAEEYVITSNRESGLGRYDVVLEPRDVKKKDAVILEFKVYDKSDEASLEDTVQSALRQIEDKKYEANLIAKGVDKKRIRKYGFAFQGKTVLIG